MDRLGVDDCGRRSAVDGGIRSFPIARHDLRSQPKLKDEYSLTFADDGIGFKTSSIDSTLQWSLYQSWLSDDDFYIMYHGKRDLSVIPRRTLSDKDDERLRQMLTEKIGPPRS